MPELNEVLNSPACAPPQLPAELRVILEDTLKKAVGRSRIQSR